MHRGYDMGEFGDLADFGEVNPIYGFVAGSALTGGAMLTFKALGRTSPNLGKYAGLWGAGVGLVGSGLAAIFPSTRRAAILAAVASGLTALPEVIRMFFLVPRGLGDYDTDMGYTTAEFAAPETPALEIMSPQLGAGYPAPVQVLQGYQPQMGYVTAEMAGTVNW